MNTLKAEKRDMSIKAKKLRREGFVTGNLFGRELEDSIPLKFDKAWSSFQAILLRMLFLLETVAYAPNGLDLPLLVFKLIHFGPQALDM